jgi:hypothetical protein
MNARVIMHNMIIEDDRGKDIVQTHHYDLMGVPVQPRRADYRMARFMASYHAIRDNKTHDELQQDLIKEWWNWFGSR